MSDQPYEVSARKYRPQIFAEVVGQEHITQTLQNALKTGQIAHAYLFAGPRGTGKTTVARLMAKALNCRSSDTMVPEPCDECESCQAITGGSSIDVFEIDGASNRGIDQIRDLRETFKYASFEGRYKVYIIDEVHMLTTEAFNALLKSLEEPPKHVVFVFATTEPAKVLPTIMSRVQRYDFRRIGIGAITDTLVMIAEREGLAADREALHLIASKAEGALRDAESLLDQVRAFSGKEITLEETRNVLGVIDSHRFFSLTELSARKDAAGALKLAAELIEEGQEPYEFLLGYADHLRYLIAAALGGETGLESLLDEEKQQYLSIADLFGLEDVLRRLEYTSSAADALRSSPQPWIAMEAAFLRLVQMDTSVDLRELLNRIDEAISSTPVSPGSSSSGGGASGPGSGSSESPNSSNSDSARADVSTVVAEQKSATAVEEMLPPPADEALPPPVEDGPEQVGEVRESGGEVAGLDPSIPPADAYEEEISTTPSRRKMKAEESSRKEEVSGVRARWKDVLEEIRRRKVTLGVLLAEADLRGVHDNKLVLAFEGENHNFHMNMVNRHMDIIREVTREIFGHAYGVKCMKAEEGSKKAGRKKKKTTDVNEQLLDRLCEKDENLKQIVEMFNARLEDTPGGRPGFQQDMGK